MEPCNITSMLFEMAASRPQALAMAFPARPGKSLPPRGPIPYNEVNFATLARETLRIARGLVAEGYKPGDRVVLLAPPGLPLFTLCYAFLRTGIIPVFIDPGIGINHLKACIGESAPIGFIGVPKAHAARVLLGWGRSTIRKTVTLGPRWFWGGRRFRDIRRLGQNDVPLPEGIGQPEDLASISFTSGSTGLPKGVMNTHENLRKQVELIRDTYGIRPGDVDLPTFAPFALLNPLIGVSSIMPDMDPTRPAQADPERIIRAVKQYQVTSMFGSPTLLDRIARYGETRQVKLPSLQRVFSAGAPVQAKILRRFSAMLNPGTQVFTPYGATEAMPVTSIGSCQLLHDDLQRHTEGGGGICLGKPVEGLKVRIIRISDDPIPAMSDEWRCEPQEIGEIVVMGKNVSPGYFGRDAANERAKIRDGQGSWHRTGDLGYFDAQGRLWFCGRKAHRVRLPEKTLYTVPCEAVFNHHPSVYRTAMVGAKGQAVLCVEVEKGTPKTDFPRLRSALLSLAAANPLTKEIQTILFHPSLPVDIRHNAKIDREKLASWAAANLPKTRDASGKNAYLTRKMQKP